MATTRKQASCFGRQRLSLLLVLHALLFAFTGADVAIVAKASNLGSSEVRRPEEVTQGLETISTDMQRVVDMPEDSQKVLLDGMGQALVSSGMWRCNIFGGVKACVAVPTNGLFMQQCNNIAKSEVDCAYSAEMLSDINEDPNVIVKDKLAEAGFEPCPACLDALHRFWCAQTVPTCGTFAKLVDEILPEMRQVSAGRMKPEELVESTLPRMLQAFSLGLPCREMCEAVTATCSCGRPSTFGQMMKVLELKRTQQQAEAEGAAGRPLAEDKDLIPFGFSTNMSLATAVKIFKGVWDRPVCDLFAPHDAPGFQGVCETWWTGAGKDKVSCKWCDSNERPEDMDEQIVAQIAQSVSSMMQAGLEHVIFAAGFPMPSLGASHSSTSPHSSATGSALNAGPSSAIATTGATTEAATEAAAEAASPGASGTDPATAEEEAEKEAEEVEEEEQKDFTWQDDQTGLPNAEPVELPPDAIPPEPTAAEPGAEPAVEAGAEGPGFFREAAPGEWGYKASEEENMAKMMRGEGGGEGEGKGEVAAGESGTGGLGNMMGGMMGRDGRGREPAGGGWDGGSTRGGTMMRGGNAGEGEGAATTDTPTTFKPPEELTPAGDTVPVTPATPAEPAAEPGEPERPPVWQKQQWQEKREEPEGGFHHNQPDEPEPRPEGGGGGWYRGNGDDLPIPPREEEKRGSPWVAVMFIVLAAGGVVGGLAFWRLRRERRSRDGGLQYIDLQEMSYRPPDF